VPEGLNNLGRRIAAFARLHPLLVGVVVIAVVLRTLVEVAYWPALFYSDSWEYVNLAYSRSIVAFSGDRPSGYPLLMHLLSLPGRSLATITIAQHLAGIAIGVTAYAFLRRLGIREWVAVVAAAVILLDSYAIALEQHIMAETFFALAILLSAAIAALFAKSPLLMATSGVLLAGAVSMRVAGLYAVPAFVLFVLVKARPARAAAAALAGLALPLLAYASLHAADGRGFGFTETIGGWALYGRVSSIADCRGAGIPAETKPLCQTAEQRAKGHPPSWYVFSRNSPAHRQFGFDPSPRVSGLLSDFAFAIVRANPADYVELVATDFARIFEPGGGGVDTPLRFPRKGSFTWESVQPLKTWRDTYFPDYRRKIREPSGLLSAYQTVFHTARWLLGALVLAIVLAAVVSLFGRPRRSARAIYLLLGGMGVGIVLGSVATVDMNVRFLVPAVPLLICGGVLASRDLAEAASTKWRWHGRRLRARPTDSSPHLSS
jgi:dolichyl-phosphate-mannose-protein mannosyltransferase